MVLVTVYNFGINAGILLETRLANLALSFGSALYFGFWLTEDARTSRYWPFYHYGTWVLVLAPVLVPVYLLKTRGAAGLLLAGALLAMMLNPSSSSTAS